MRRPRPGRRRRRAFVVANGAHRTRSVIGHEPQQVQPRSVSRLRDERCGCRPLGAGRLHRLRRPRNDYHPSSADAHERGELDERTSLEQRRPHRGANGRSFLPIREARRRTRSRDARGHDSSHGRATSKRTAGHSPSRILGPPFEGRRGVVLAHLAAHVRAASRTYAHCGPRRRTEVLQAHGD